jgi:hypothetical protein
MNAMPLDATRFFSPSVCNTKEFLWTSDEQLRNSDPEASRRAVTVKHDSPVFQPGSLVTTLAELFRFPIAKLSQNYAQKLARDFVYVAAVLLFISISNLRVISNAFSS